MVRAKIRVLIAKPGLDGHDRGAKVIARALRDAGMVVTPPYTGPPPDSGDDCVGSFAGRRRRDRALDSVWSGTIQFAGVLMDLLAANGMANVIVLIGGIIPEADIPGLKQAGVSEIAPSVGNTHPGNHQIFIQERVSAAPQKT